MCGPPGNGSPSSRATLSKASPAASSMVAPSGSTLAVTSSTSSRTGVSAADQQRHARLGQRAVLELVDGDVRGEMVDAVQRLAQPERERLGGRDADQQRAGQPRPGGDGDGVDIGQAMPAVAQARSMVGTIASRCARLATSGTTPPKRACSSTLDATASASSVCRARCRHPSRRRRSRSPAPGARAGTRAAIVATSTTYCHTLHVVDVHRRRHRGRPRVGVVAVSPVPGSGRGCTSCANAGLPGGVEQAAGAVDEHLDGSSRSTPACRCSHTPRVCLAVPRRVQSRGSVRRCRWGCSAGRGCPGPGTSSRSRRCRSRPAAGHDPQEALLVVRPQPPGLLQSRAGRSSWS